MKLNKSRQHSAVIGLQWGDEGKGKITDFLVKEHDIVVRFQGGPNAGHTIYRGDKKFVFHHLPSGSLNHQKINLIDHGVIINPKSLLGEIESLKKNTDSQRIDNLLISPLSHVITPYDVLLDSQREETAGKVGSTKRGIGPTYEAKTGRKGIRLQDFANPKELKEKCEVALAEKIFLLRSMYKTDVPSIDDFISEYLSYYEKLKPYFVDSFQYLNQAHKNGKRILYEGAQGVLLDVNFGTYPFVTSSSPGASGLFLGTWIPGREKIEVYGVTKAYTTRVGEGPFPTQELNEEKQNLWAKTAHEYGATTGRQRRCGHLDFPLLRYALNIQQVDNIVVTKVDLLKEIYEKIEGSNSVCQSYSIDGEKYSTVQSHDIFSEYSLNFEKVPKELIDVDGEEFYHQFANFLSKNLEKPISIISHGPGLDEVIKL